MKGCCAARPPLRLLVIPGLHDSGPGHWQSWLERRYRSALRVQQADWSQGRLDAWAESISATLAAQPPGPWLAVAHSYGCLALLQHLAERGESGRCGVVAALLVAPADPQRHGVERRLQQRSPLREATVGASSNDPWLPTGAALPWAQRWGARLIDLGDAGHINIASGHGPWPLGRTLVERQLQRWQAACRAEAEAAEAAVLAPQGADAAGSAWLARSGKTLPTLAST